MELWDAYFSISHDLRLVNMMEMSSFVQSLSFGKNHSFYHNGPTLGKWNRSSRMNVFYCCLYGSAICWLSCQCSLSVLGKEPNLIEVTSQPIISSMFIDFPSHQMCFVHQNTSTRLSILHIPSLVMPCQCKYTLQLLTMVVTGRISVEVWDQFI